MITMKDVAREANVSNATVSRVLQGEPHVREEVRVRVLATVKRMGYKPSRVARSLRTNKSSVIGMVITDVQNPFFTTLARAVEDVCYENNYAVFLCNVDENIEKERFYIDTMLAEKVAGVVISPTQETNNPSWILVKAGIPVVSVDRRMLDLTVDTVTVDNISGAYKATTHLIDHGCRDIAIITGPKNSTTGRERLEGYIKALQDHQMNVIPEYIKIGSFKSEYGYKSMMELLKLSHPPTAVFTANYPIAQGAFNAIRQNGLKIPDDIKLIAYDQIELDTIYDTSITYMAQPSYDLGKIASKLLFARINAPESPIQKIMLEPSLHIGHSCGCLAQLLSTPETGPSSRVTSFNPKRKGD